MVEYIPEYNDKGKQNKVVRFLDYVRNIVITYNSKITVVPSNLPMVTPPKAYKL